MSSAKCRPFCLGLTVLMTFIHRLDKQIYRDNKMYTTVQEPINLTRIYTENTGISRAMYEIINLASR